MYQRKCGQKDSKLTQSPSQKGRTNTYHLLINCLYSISLMGWEKRKCQKLHGESRVHWRALHEALTWIAFLCEQFPLGRTAGLGQDDPLREGLQGRWLLSHRHTWLRVTESHQPSNKSLAVPLRQVHIPQWMTDKNTFDPSRCTERPAGRQPWSGALLPRLLWVKATATELKEMKPPWPSAGSAGPVWQTPPLL